ncbi:hypothetical protein OPQ81_005150 [Rhizoctonia solani]|nr:hypothetical protein OPQ81_005150 [Rhizoctonia solani]
MSLDHLIIKPATKAQAHEAIVRNAAHWGARAGINVDDYVKLSAIVQEGVFARDGRLQTSPSSSFGHLITYVIVPPEHRAKGYAKLFMSLMHSVLAPHRYPNPVKVPTATDHPSTVSVLYSSVGDYYARCAPLEGESGWTLQKSLITTWRLSDVQISEGTSPAVKILSESDVTETLDSDDSNIPTDLLELQEKDPMKTYFAFVPTAPLNAYSVTLGKLFLKHVDGPSNPSWGAKIPGTSNFMTWTYFGLPNLELIVTRLRATADSFPLLLHAALRAARDAKCASVAVWNVPEHLNGIARETDGETAERDDDLSAFKWYGQEPDLKTDNAGIVWALDERWELLSHPCFMTYTPSRYSWC